VGAGAVDPDRCSFSVSGFRLVQTLSVESETVTSALGGAIVGTAARGG